MSVKEQMLEARDLIKAKRYDEARAILKRIDHPTAQQWLESLDQLAPPPAPKQSWSSASAYSSDDDWMTPESAKPKRDALYDDSSNTGSSEKLPTMGLILMMIATVVVGFGGGVLLFLSSKVTWLIFFQVILASVVAGSIVSAAVKSGKVRAGLVAAFFGGLAGFLMYSTYRYAEYLDFYQQEWQSTVTQWREDPQLQGQGYTQPEIDDLLNFYLENETGQGGFEGHKMFIDRYFVDETGSSGFIGYIKWNAKYGMTVEDTTYGYSTSNPTELGTEMTVGYWVLEILIMVGGAGLVAMSQANQPFCEETDEWLKFTSIGGINNKARNNFLEIIRMEDYPRASDFLAHPDAQGNHLRVEVARCSEHSPTALLRIMEQQRRSTKQILKKEISAQDYKDLTKNAKSVV